MSDNLFYCLSAVLLALGTALNVGQYASNGKPIELALAVFFGLMFFISAIGVHR